MARRKDSPQKAAMREMMRGYLKSNDISIKSGNDVNSVMRDMMSVLLEGALDEELDEELGYSKYDYRNKETDNSRNGHSQKTMHNIMRQRMRLVNQLHEQLHIAYPSYKQFFSDISRPTALYFWAHYPSRKYLKGKDVATKQGNRRLQATIYFLAIQMIQVSSKGTPRHPVFRAYYEKRKAEGKTSQQALICISRRLINIIYGMLKNGTEYRMPELKETGEKM